MWRWGAALAASLLLAVAATIYWLPTRWHSYTTSTGEQRALQLPDGTTVHLNMRSRIDVRFSQNERSVRLLEGEALFNVARDAQRPFRVQSGASSIQAVGTEFNVLRRPLGTTVSVIEGIVQVSAPVQQPARLGAGEEARITVDGHIEKRQSVKVGAVAQWRQHRLEFRTDALVDIAAEFNRYNSGPQLIVTGDAIKTRHYSGVFDANDPVSLIEFLKQDPDLVLERRGEAVEIRAR
jgi:transmembrane sensor